MVQFAIGGMVFGGGMILAHLFHTNRIVVITCMVISIVAASLIVSWENGSTIEQIWMFSVACVMGVLGYYGSAKLLYGDDYWRR